MACHASCGRGVFPSLPMDVSLGHVTCFGQLNVSESDISHVQIDTLRGIVRLRRCSFFSLMRMAGLRRRLLFKLVP